ncbi:MAG: amidohydrolase family protein [Lentisphaeria bacterium]|nr:amidohydrolase family protein [Lentisphaeria bacterium]
MQDLHIHVFPGRKDSPAEFVDKTRAAGVTGGAVLGMYPETFGKENEDQRWQARLDYVLDFCSQAPGFRPMFWIDPLAEDALEQVQTAVEKGIAGFKVICNYFYPVKGLKTYQAIAETGLPLMFHSGVLYNEQPSSEYNRPMSFEFLMDVKGLRFSLAHISWPWCAELVSLFGKLNYLDECAPEGRSQMYYDITPGTPPIFREEALRRIYMTGLRVKHRVLWGTDCLANDYNVEYARYWADLDRKIYDGISADPNRYRVAGQDEYDYSDIWDLATDGNFAAFYGKK